MFARRSNAMTSKSTHKSIRINPKYLCQHWVDSREETRTDGECTYRPKDFKEFPLSWFRMRYIFHQNGDCDWYASDAGDAHHFMPGKWSVDPNDRSILQITVWVDIFQPENSRRELHRVTELKKDILRMVWIGRDTGTNPRKRGLISRFMRRVLKPLGRTRRLRT